MSKRIAAPYGSWLSPVTASMVASAGTGRGTLEELRVTRHAAYWIEIRPEEGGRSGLFRFTPSHGAQALLPDGFSVRSRVHEYGGGSLVVDDSALYFVNFTDQRMYRRKEGAVPWPITPAADGVASVRYADGELSADRNFLVAVRESHSAEGVVNELALLSTDGERAPQTLVAGHDFFAFPRLHPKGDLLAWITWDHPQMPWQGSELWVARVGDGWRLDTPYKVAGGAQESVFQPTWGPDGRLYFISDRSGWWNLYVQGEQGEARLVFSVDGDLGVPQWALGFSRYIVLPGGEIACLVGRGGMDELCLFSPAEARLERLPTGLTSCYPPNLRWDGKHLWMIGGSPTTPQSIVRYDLRHRRAEVVHRSIEVDLDREDLSSPEHFSYASASGRRSFAFFYAPKSSRFHALRNEAPPLLVASHGGPTSAAHTFLSPWIQYWTTRGIAVVDVNYGGSSGYGRAYRDLLHGAWGIVDVEDCVQAAVALANLRRADGNRLMIRGGSAGGFTTLCALAFFRVFGAAASYYGVADLELLARDTHKFEAHYLDWLLGPLPQAASLYRARSPIHHLDHFDTPVILFHGEDDTVVPVSQAERLAAALSARRIPHALLRYAGEGHGFRKADNIRRSYEAELFFYARILGFPLVGDVAPVRITDLPPR